MHLAPPLSADEAFEHLKAQATLAWGPTHAESVEEDLKLLAEAMAQISAMQFPRTLEPLFP